MLSKVSATAIACVFTVLALTSRATAQSAQAYVKADSVNVRASASTSARVVTVVSRGASATVISRHGEWAKLRFKDGTVGYVRRDLLSSAPAGSQVSGSSVQRVAIKGSVVNVRSKPTTGSSVVKTVGAGTVATVLERAGEWAKLRFSDGKVGYVRRDFLTSNLTIQASGSASKRVAIKAPVVNVRRGPGTNSDVMTTVRQGTVATLLSTNGEWARLQFSGGTVGWVRRDLLTSNLTMTASHSGPEMVVTKVDAAIVRSGPSTSTKQVAKVARDTVATVIGREGDWVKLRFQGGTVGYVRKDLLASAPSNGRPTHSTTGEKINYISTSLVKVNANNVVVRKSPNTGGKKITQVDRGTVATVLDRQGAWYRIRLEHGTVGFVRGDLLNPFTRTGSSRTASSAYVASKSAPKLPINPNDVLVVAEAKKMLGTPYVFASSTTRGVDCSGLAYYLYRNFEGVTLPRTSRDMANFGTPVSRENVSPGDLLFFHTRGSSRINHVGIYIGNGKFIHASRSAGRVIVGDCNGGYYQSRLAAIRRVKPTLKKVGGGSSTATKPAESRPEPKPDQKPEATRPEETERGLEGNGQ